VQALSDASYKLWGPIKAGLGKDCHTAEQFQDIMEPAQALAKLLPGQEASTLPAPQLLRYLQHTAYRDLRQLLVALAWSAPVVIPGATPHGLDPDQPPKVWGEVAGAVARTLLRALPHIPGGQKQLVCEVLVVEGANQLAGGCCLDAGRLCAAVVKV
jgi:hypothetical protein